MKLRLIQPGWETYNGQMGVINFVDGVSDDHVSTKDATRMAAVMNCKWDENDDCISPTDHLLRSQNVEAPVMPDDLGAEGEATEAAVVETAPAPVQASTAITMAQAEAIVDAKGIAGLREIAEPLGIKGRAVAELLSELVNAGAVLPAVTQEQ